MLDGAGARRVAIWPDEARLSLWDLPPDDLAVLRPLAAWAGAAGSGLIAWGLGTEARIAWGLGTEARTRAEVDKASLLDLFEDRGRLLIYHFMFDPD